ncbi:LysR family transcriptional regulator [Novosphingobium sp. MBES04]|uniref:LysR family transcriptional regulator n=1 Tax=Novosphingobium sp. MBES04 TaxID=1206458 RepID=UPI0011869909|nr:LysR family transcriptional regulator [Novosphingobium sp. MBES04]
MEAKGRRPIVRVAFRATAGHVSRMLLDDRWITYLHETVQAGSVRAAADKLNINASAVSRQISMLERKLGVNLLERHNKGVRVTEAGELLLDYHRRRLADEEDTVGQIGDLRNLKRGRVSLAMGEGFVGVVSSGSLKRFTRDYPLISISMETTGTNEAVRLVLEDAVHLALVYSPPRDPRLRSHVSVNQAVSVIVSPDHPLARRGEPLHLADLVEYPLAQMQKAFGIRQVVQNVEQVEGIRLTTQLSSSSIAALKNYAEYCGGATLLPAFTAAQEIVEGRLVALPIQHQGLSGHAHVVSRSGRELPSASKNFLRYLIADLQELSRASRN